MAFSDPITLDVFGDDNNVLNKVGVDASGTTFRTADGSLELTVMHSYGKRTRRAVKLKFLSTQPDTYQTDHWVPTDMSVTIVMDVPKYPLLTQNNQLDVAKAAMSFLTSTSYANLYKLIEGQV